MTYLEILQEFTASPSCTGVSHGIRIVCTDRVTVTVAGLCKLHSQFLDQSRRPPSIKRYSAVSPSVKPREGGSIVAKHWHWTKSVDAGAARGRARVARQPGEQAWRWPGFPRCDGRKDGRLAVAVQMPSFSRSMRRSNLFGVFRLGARFDLCWKRSK